ncbi:MAG TPA: Mur ligase domain-containing protein, partial [Solirubrobacterales bacterium]|nr:Mur ligase domain-containing protein [Solirubrobacterales bacterium]
MNLTPQQIAAALGAEVLAEGAAGPPARATIDSSQTGPGDLFFGLRGANRDGGEFAPAALEAGAWGAVVGPASRGSLS